MRQVPQLFPFIKATVDEWLKPLGVHLRKDKPVTRGEEPNSLSLEETSLESLLPPKDDVDTLISIYLKYLEQLHRVVHIPTFEREYLAFWELGQTRSPAMTALVLSMISISTCVYPSSQSHTSIPLAYQAMSVQWISACDKWLRQQSSKHRKLVHYQISCLLYFAKRMNLIRKKRFWKETGSLIQDAIVDGLHCDSSLTSDSPYTGEMRKRIWATLRELDLQNSFEYGLPTLLHCIDSTVAAPANLDDEDFDEALMVPPISRPSGQYTCTSYQYHSSRSWRLRCDISRRLFSVGVSEALNYEDVLRYTHEITQAIDSLPLWGTAEEDGDEVLAAPIFAHTLLHFQLKECMLAMHQPYLRKNHDKFWLSENVCYHMSRDILLLNSKLVGLKYQTLTLLREDLIRASLNLSRLTLLQPKGESFSVPFSDLDPSSSSEQGLDFFGVSEFSEG